MVQHSEAFGAGVFAAPTEPGATMTGAPQALTADSLYGISKRKVTKASLLPSTGAARADGCQHSLPAGVRLGQRGSVRWRGGDTEGAAGWAMGAGGRAISRDAFWR